MNSRRLSLSAVRLVVVLGAALIFLQGCRTTPKIDWNTRVGNYTYDQAVAELGPPDKWAKLTDGKTVADWITGRSGGSGFSIGTGVFGGHGGMSVGQTVGSGGSLRYLRLIFGPDNRLESWSKG